MTTWAKIRGQFASALADLFDQTRPFGRLALVQVLMIMGDTLVTISLAGSLFFSISPQAAKSNVLLYLAVTIAPFAVVSPLLGPLIDRGQGARRAMVVFSALGRALVCPLMALNLDSLYLFPAAFVILILSKVYGVTKGALVPEMAAHEALARGHDGDEFDDANSYAEWNAKLVLLGTVAGFVASIPGVLALKLIGAPAVLYLDAVVFALSGIAAFRLPSMKGKKRRTAESNSLQSRHLATLQPVAHPEVTAALTVNALLRGVAGFFVFLIAFGLRRIHAPLFWYGLVLGMSGLGAMVGLVVMARIRRHFSEQTILVIAAVLVCLAGILAAWVDAVWIQIVLALLIGIGGSLGQPSFDAMAQRYVPVEVQGRAFARFATRQQLIWVVGALLAVIIPLTLKEGDITVAAVAGVSVIGYGISRSMMRNKALPRAVQHHERD